ncbi:MAG: hypothetical protein ACNI26_15355 [Terasakiella sp.]|uniref:hypothetical protein n=1 Tax=unclassified Terasakiella TaxID=2614952 RepID=UPI003AA8BCCC
MKQPENLLEEINASLSIIRFLAGTVENSFEPDEVCLFKSQVNKTEKNAKQLCQLAQEKLGSRN